MSNPYFSTLHSPVTIETPDGTQTLLGRRDILEIADKYVSKDYADFLEDLLTEIDAETYRTELEFNSDYRAYEQSCEDFHLLLVDSADTIYEIIEGLSEGKRMNKSKLLEKLLNLYKDMNGVI